jgi:sugar phosphate isomerase/epimerase
VTSPALPQLGFSTLACPEWDADEVLRRALDAGYDAIEWRGGPDGTVLTTWPASHRAALRRRLADAGIGSIAVTTYSNLISGDAGVRQRSITDAVAHADLAADLAAPAIRVFLGVRDDDSSDEELATRAIAGLGELLELVRPTGVSVAIEPHDQHVRAASIEPLLAPISDTTLGVVWDIANAWSAGEPPALGIAAYDGRIAYVQVKDGTGAGPTWRLCRLGEGEVPLDNALSAVAGRAVAAGRPIPAISVEWERAWHDHLDPAAIALPAARAWLREHVAQAVAAAVALSHTPIGGRSE